MRTLCQPRNPCRPPLFPLFHRYHGKAETGKTWFMRLHVHIAAGIQLQCTRTKTDLFYSTG